MSAGRSFNAMAVPPAATMARFDADLSMIALEAIGTQQNLFEPKPGLSRTSLFAHTEPARDIPAVFIAQAIPPPREHACENRRDHLKPGSERSRLHILPLAGTAEAGGSRIAVIQCRFYDLAGWKATPISDAGKKRFRWGRSSSICCMKRLG
ncbi:MAG: hypothetical protein E5X80_13010 [Mesorhizobium sp.]|uniref:hypothetical protein n=1 Tax=Mesorhizobium sp. TaxID=1871066 RepID=UPI000FE76489|nr:hypothetical protein [Mesorhizobium sp.]RWM05862.1 MAG: hypothetical protein EOR71_22245 [Mesorhizobium sp.]TIO51432.1 MAG: hypothetical protein E5X78_16700 [Mesorhizobium sp.]TIO59682.1 MAG: hypothetical protein E5X79_16105 [Mesorhizobium sp.]TJV64878.1 MAG: hypothetical protein E5X80_13010 [Mesorhizobium sp.]